MRRVGLAYLSALWLGLASTAGQAAPPAVASVAAPAVPADLQIRDAWIRWLPGDLPAGGYLTLVNDGSTTVHLLGASSADYGSVSLHQSRSQGGRATMTPVAAIAVKAHATLNFAAQGYHLMLAEPNKALKVGDHVAITLHFEGGGSIPAQFELRPPDVLMSK